MVKEHSAPVSDSVTALNAFLDEYHCGVTQRRLARPDVMQDALARYLLSYSDGWLQPRMGSDIEPPPLHPRVAEILGAELWALFRGEDAPLFKRSTKRGSPRSGPEVRDAQRAAVKYMHWCEASLLRDPNPRATIERCFSLRKGTARKWLRAYGDITAPESATHYDSEVVKIEMLYYGVKYPYLPGARTQKAVANRDAKRRGEKRN